MNKLKVIFIGGLTNGKIVYEYLKKNKYVDIPLAITYKENTSKPRFRTFDDEVFIKSNSANEFIDDMKKIHPDFIFVSGWSELLYEELIKIPEKGTIGFHGSILPKDRGRSVLAWQIEEGYKKTAVTMFYYNNMPDGGDIIGQEEVIINDNDYINDILDKCDEAVYNLIYSYFPLLRKGQAPRIKQDESKSTFRRLRKKRDSLINWNRNTVDIYNKIRAISKPYPGAIGKIGNKQYRIWKAEIIEEFEFGNICETGQLVATLFDKSIIIKTKDKFIRITEYEV